VKAQSAVVCVTEGGPAACPPRSPGAQTDRAALADADAHAAAFHEAPGRELARRLGWGQSGLRQEWQSAREAVAAFPPFAARVVQGHPAQSAQYLFPGR